MDPRNQRREEVSPRNFEVQVGDIIWKQHQEQLSSRFIPPTLSERSE